MPRKRELTPASVWDVPRLEDAFAEAGVKPGWIPKLLHWLLHHPGDSWHGLPDLPKAAARLLDERFCLSTSRLVHHQVSADGETTKLLVELQDGLQVEAVIMRYDTTQAAPCADGGDSGGGSDGGSSGVGPADQQAGAREQQRQAAQQTGGPRATLCVSSQVGCQMGCTFCATGQMGLMADLTAGEIVEQLVHATRVAQAAAADAAGGALASATAATTAAYAGRAVPAAEGAPPPGAGAAGRRLRLQRAQQLPIQNVVFMGMGEPLNNYAAVKAAVGLMVDSRVFSMARRKVTVSTVGIIPRLLQLADDLPGVSLALSLHAPTQELRRQIVPSARAYKLDRLLEAVRTYQAKTGQRVFIEYVMLGPDVNCTPQHAAQLGALLAGVSCVVNLIPWNPILSPSMPFAAPPPGVVEAFKETLQTQFGLPATMRQEKGQDISGACGQLVLERGGRPAPRGGESGAARGGGGGGGAQGRGAGLRDVEDLVGRPACR